MSLHGMNYEYMIVYIIMCLYYVWITDRYIVMMLCNLEILEYKSKINLIGYYLLVIDKMIRTL